MNGVFLDSVGLIALWNRNDQWHTPAKAAMTLANAPNAQFVSTSYVLMECGNAGARTPFRADVCALRDRLILRRDLIEPSAAEIDEAWAAYRKNTAGGASIVDHISFVIMRRMGITDAFTNDRHFKAAGFNTLF
jgi:predicted nucleic acid-binding protein